MLLMDHLIRRLALSGFVILAIGCRDDTTSPVPTDPTPALATAATPPLTFNQLSAGRDHTCGVTTGNRLYCWGDNLDHQLGDGSTAYRQLRPVPVATSLVFRQVSAGGAHTCAVTTTYRVYCWGYNATGQLGDGTTSPRSTPVAIATTLQFRAVAAGHKHTCAIGYADNRAYCWGDNEFGKLGDGTTAPRLRPTRIAGSFTVTQVAAGWDHTCAVTPAYQAWCWGSNFDGRLGSGTAVSSSAAPVRVAGTRQFRQIDAGGTHTCAVTPSNGAFCWGLGLEGEIGDGTTQSRSTPRAVAGGIAFARVITGYALTCASTPGGVAYCWGRNSDGQVGDGTLVQRRLPTLVVGNLKFEQMHTSNGTTCGKTYADLAYCWGGNGYGQVGDGSTNDRVRPHAVAGPL